MAAVLRSAKLTDMDRNQATGLILIFGILFVYFTFLAPSPEQLPEKKKEAAARKAAVSTKAGRKAVNLPPAVTRDLGLADSALAADTAPVVLENTDLKVWVSPSGARIERVWLKSYKTWNGSPLEPVVAGSFAQSVSLPLSSGLLDIHQMPYSARLIRAGECGDSTGAEFSRMLPGGRTLRYKLLLPPRGFDLSARLEAGGFAFSQSAVQMDYALDARQLEKDLEQNRTSTCVNYMSAASGFSNLSETSLSEEKAELREEMNWVSFKQKFFNVGFIPKGVFTGARLRQKTDEADSLSVKRMEAGLTLPLDGGRLSWRFYFGPNHFKTLKAVAPDYDKNVYLGWPVINLVNRFITVNVFYWLEGSVTHNYGLIIVILVLLIKLILLPLSYRSYVSMAKMKVLKPELDAIKEKTGDDMQAAQAEQMKLYQQVGINPISGCIPLLLQMPILLAVFNFFPNAIELRQESFLWAPDLSTYDSVATLPFRLPGYGDHVSLFTILMTASTLVLTWYNNQTSTVAGPMQSMSYIMPVVFMFILNSLPAGLSFYYLVSNLVSIVQQQVIKRFVDENSLRRKLEDNKVKNANKKKTGFAARLEEAMRVAQEAQREKEKNSKRPKGDKK